MSLLIFRRRRCPGCQHLFKNGRRFNGFNVLYNAFFQAEQFIRELIGNPDFDIEDLGEDHMSSSALHELGNILAGSYLTALADLTKLQLYPSVPEVSLDMFGAVISEGLMELSQVGEHAIVVDTSIFDQSHQQELKAHMFMLPDYDSFEKLFVALGASL